MSLRFTHLMSVPSFPSYRWIFLVSFHRESRQQASFVEEQCKLWKHRICGLTVKDVSAGTEPLVGEPSNSKAVSQFRKWALSIYRTTWCINCAQGNLCRCRCTMNVCVYKYTFSYMSSDINDIENEINIFSRTK